MIASQQSVVVGNCLRSRWGREGAEGVAEGD